MRAGVLAAAAVLAVSLVARLLVPSVSLYLEPFEIRQGHLWQLVTWIPAGASLTFLAHAALVGLGVARGVSVRVWLGATFTAGVLATLASYAVPAVLSCTFTGAGVSATVVLWAFRSKLEGGRRALATLLPLVPAGLDAAVDGLYVLLPHALALFAAAGWVRWSRRSHPKL